MHNQQAVAYKDINKNIMWIRNNILYKDTISK